MEGGRASGRGACRGLAGEMPIAEPSSSSGSGPMKRLATNGHAYYSVARQTDAAWHDLLTRVAEEASVAFDFLSYPLPQSLEELWTRADLGCVFIMCGYPISLRQLPVVPIAAPIPLASWAQGRAVYRTDLVVRADSRYQRLSDTFGGRIGWTACHSRSEEHTSELQSPCNLVCRLLLEKK